MPEKYTIFADYCFCNQKQNSVKIKEVLRALEQFAPLPLQEDYDNAGLQVGLTETDASGALLCLDVTEEVIDEAISLGCNLIVSHHPLIFRPLRRLTDQNMVQRCVMKAVKNDITIISMHTNLDNAIGGVNYKMAGIMQLADVRPLAPKTVMGTEGGSGVVGVLPQPMSAGEFVGMLKERFAVECVQANELLRRPISRVALCGGAGAFLLDEAIACQADAFVTGEMHYHEYFGHEQEIQICVIGHYQSEQYTNEILQSIIKERCEGVGCYLTKVNTNPIICL